MIEEEQAGPGFIEQRQGEQEPSDRAHKPAHQHPPTQQLKSNISLILCVQEVITPIYIMSYYINWVTTSWT